MMNIQDIFVAINEDIRLGDSEGNEKRMAELAWFLNCHQAD